jgi:hypothetical protein
MRVDRQKFLVAVAAVAGVYGVASSSDAAESSSSTDGACRAGAVSRPLVCDDAHGSPGDCRKADCRRLPFICQHCEDYKAAFKPKIAERAVACVVGQTGSQLGDGCRTYQCGDEALGGACLDPTAALPCLAISRSCNTTIDECTGLLSGMNETGRQKIVACAAAGCRFGLWSCVEGL